MNTENQALLEQRIESSLAQLPEWQPPADFAKRLAAAAARQQSSTPVVAAPKPAWGELIPLVLASTGLAVVLAWAVPWSQLSATALMWTCVAGMSAAGALFTLRVLRSP